MALTDGDDQRHKIGRRFYTALACYAAIAILAGLTLGGKFRIAVFGNPMYIDFRYVVWFVLFALVVRTYLLTRIKP